MLYWRRLTAPARPAVCVFMQMSRVNACLFEQFMASCVSTLFVFSCALDIWLSQTGVAGLTPPFTCFHRVLMMVAGAAARAALPPTPISSGRGGEGLSFVLAGVSFWLSIDLCLILIFVDFWWGKWPEVEGSRPMESPGMTSSFSQIIHRFTRIILWKLAHSQLDNWTTHSIFFRIFRPFWLPEISDGKMGQAEKRAGINLIHFYLN